ncbi:hypothetical protein L211DRAFT_459682 [Terfezia boudieri ATCC MYA-4762]|uniref:Uncharacterized protein n=1 Tax=Terfezia boudieri ATCC MYA-4762 TaxID=1051890 RepID=A0A3N4LDX3_9PEZI|nr:hypothetical protein L211DRAFT_459682 [Terfezia boudieri ATCC MYA-4762]
MRNINAGISLPGLVNHFCTWYVCTSLISYPEGHSFWILFFFFFAPHNRPHRSSTKCPMKPLFAFPLFSLLYIQSELDKCEGFLYAAILVSLVTGSLEENSPKV